MTDTAAKRRSAIDVGSPWRSLLGPHLDATVSDQDRAVTAYQYRGLDYAGDGDDEAAGGGGAWYIVVSPRVRR